MYKEFGKWRNSESLHSEHNICDCSGHGECGGGLYQSSRGHFARCHRHIILQAVWSDAPIRCDLFDWLDGLEGDTTQVIYEEMQGKVGMWYWETIIYGFPSHSACRPPAIPAHDHV